MRPRGFVTGWLSIEQAASMVDRDRREVLEQVPWVLRWGQTWIPVSALRRLEHRLNEHGA